MKKILHTLGVLKVYRLLLTNIFKLNIFNGQIGKFLIDEYDGSWGQNVTRKTGSIGNGFLHFGIIVASESSNILCIGSQRGFIPVICALACKLRGKGHVDFVDAGYSFPHPKAWSGDGFWKRTNPKKHFKKVKADKWISTYVMTSKEFAHKYPKRRYDYIYIDGDHAYKGVKEDFRLFWPRLKRAGFISFHDIRATGAFRKRYKFGVTRFWNEVTEKGNAISLFKKPGLGILQKS